MNIKALLTFLLVGCLITPQMALSKDDKDKKKDKKEKTVKELIKDKILHDGYLDFYQDPKTGSMMLSITDEQLNKPMIYFVHTVNGVLDAGHFKGAFRETKIIEFKKHFNRIEIISTTPRYYIDPNSAMSRSSGTNISSAILASVKISAEDKKKGQYLVKIDPVLLTEVLHKVSPYPSPKEPGKPPPPPSFKVGKLSKDKTKYLKIKSYPLNTDVIVEYAFDNSAPSVRGGLEITDARSVVIQMQHSFIELPKNNYKPRRDDPRVGYFTQEFDDLTSDKWAPYKDVINRWSLVKKNPELAISEPVEPILWWIENTTPVEWRETIKNAALQWNIAFEKSGFKNALQIKIQPDDAEWDAGDIRYNVLRWTTSPNPPFGGYGPSLANPLTGQIIAADIMLENVFMKNRRFHDRIMVREPLENNANTLFCSAGHFFNDSILTAQTVLNAQGSSLFEKNELVKQELTSLILHELGHTLGLNHNMKASQRYNETEVHNAELTQGSLTGSVMDYAPVNIAPPGMKQGDYASTKPGSYDLWVIEYGYSTALVDPIKEEARLTKILSRSTEADLVFGNDADDMRSAGRHIDPRVMTGDMSNNAIEYSRNQIKLMKHSLLKLRENTTHDGESYQELNEGFGSLVRRYFNASTIASRYIGGVYIDRAMVGQEGATQPYTPVAKVDQKRAMKLLSDYLFAPNILEEAVPLYAYLQKQRRSFSLYGKNEDPKLHGMFLKYQKRVLEHLLHKNVLLRLTDSSLYGNEYHVNEMLNDLTQSIFNADKNTDVTSIRQNLQHEYVKHLIKISGLKKPKGYDYQSQAAALNQLLILKDLGKYQKNISISTKAHRVYLSRLIEISLEK